jgi:sterol desaturase/sphingolipid hydroxylase (fatty acid hydroxylase superfamily)
MNWDVIKNGFWPEIFGSFWLAAGYWAVLTLLVGLEFFVPQFQEPERHRRWPANFGLGVINMALLPLLPVSALLAAEWAQSHQVGLLNLLDGSWWPLAAIATIAVQSLSSYVLHVVMHKVPWFWRLHRVHHLDTALDLSTGLRHHPLEYFLTLLTDISAAIVFGLTPWALIAYGTVDGIFSFYGHANIRLPARLDHALRYFMVTPRIHAVHHSSYQPETDSNYGSIFTVWDRIFGTYNDQLADRPEVRQYGLREVQDERAANLWWQLKSPVLRLDDAPETLAARSKTSLS